MPDSIKVTFEFCCDVNRVRLGLKLMQINQLMCLDSLLTIKLECWLSCAFEGGGGLLDLNFVLEISKLKIKLTNKVKTILEGGVLGSFI
jgi:hypothetical protein